ncbi:MAG: FAD-dependent oxidoreductase [Deltaproteobacteria bacterium]|nr:FAD-dependent oxidoreductase [Deltaproteobacteria bacterium]
MLRRRYDIQGIDDVISYKGEIVMEKLVVIGGVAAGLSAASVAKRLKRSNIDVMVFEKSGYISYGACSEPYFVSGLVPRPEDLVEISAQEFEEKRLVHIYKMHEVIEIDYKGGYVTAIDLSNNKKFTQPFDYLMIATGAKAKALGVPGETLEGICTLRTVEDAIDVKNSVSSGREVVICGGGYIGLEMAEAFVSLDLNVTILKKTPQMLLNFDPEISALVEEEVRSKGVKIETGIDVLAFEGEGKVEKVVTNKGEVKADAVLIAKGATPNVDIARQIGIKIGSTGAIAVDEHQRTNIDRVYAGGDCAEAYHIVLGKPAYIPLGTTANKTGRIAGENIGGLDTKFGGIVGTAVSKIFDLEVARTGLSLREATKNGFDAYATNISHRSRSKHYPGGCPITVQFIAERHTKRLLGAQMIGKEGVAHRIDVIAAALHAGMSADDIYGLDLAYAPPFAPVWDPILVAANKARKG